MSGKRLYKHSEVDHDKLFSLVSKLRGDFLMTYDYSDMVTKLAYEFGFDVRTIRMTNTHHKVMREILIGKDLRWFKPLE